MVYLIFIKEVVYLNFQNIFMTY